MKKTAALLEKLIRLVHGETLPSSSMKGDWFDQMQADGVLTAVIHGSRKSLRAYDGMLLRKYIESQYDIRDLEQTYKLLMEGESSRRDQVELTGDSKFTSKRTFSGFLLNSYQPIEAILAGNSITVFPAEGSYMFMADYRRFIIPEDVVVIGMENAENFRHVSRQRHLFAKYEKVLFVSRYPQEQSKDLLTWLSSIPNRYIHFGDFDLAGIHIFLSEYYPLLGGKSSFFIPEDIEERLSKGSLKRYNAQYGRFHDLHSEIPELQSLIDLIHRYHRGYDQEGYIERT